METSLHSNARLTKPATFLALNFFNRFLRCDFTVSLLKYNSSAISQVVYSLIIKYRISFSRSDKSFCMGSKYLNCTLQINKRYVTEPQGKPVFRLFMENHELKVLLEIQTLIMVIPDTNIKHFKAHQSKYSEVSDMLPVKYPPWISFFIA